MITALGQKLATQGFRVEDEAVLACNGTGLRNLLQAGCQRLEVHVEIVNNLNVFPVPDGDTGTNMLLTVRSALEEMERTADGTKVGALAQAAAQGALMGARGNSGVILSQFLQGLAIGLADRTEFTVVDFARAVELGVHWAYRSVIEPVEGTILTVARAVAEAAGRSVRRNQNLSSVLADIVDAARVAQARTPELLPVLKDAGVTDAGGQGLVYIFEGALIYLLGKSLEFDPFDIPASPLIPTLRVGEEAYGYDIQFLIQGDRLDIEQIRSEIDRLGQSTLVAGDENLVKVHLHASDPEAVIAVGARYGEIGQIVVEDLTAQARQFRRRTGLPTAHVTIPVSVASEIATVAVVTGNGLARIFRSLGVSRIIAGGPSMNPSIQDLLGAVRQVEAGHVLILPNNGNVIMTARQIGTLSGKSVQVIPTKTVPQGIAALLAFSDQADILTNERRMLEAARHVQTIEITRAVRSGRFNGFEIRLDDVVGLHNGMLAARGREHRRVVLDVLAQIELDSYEILTMYYGQDSSAAQAETLAGRIRDAYPELEYEIHPGGQPHYQYIISLE